MLTKQARHILLLMNRVGPNESFDMLRLETLCNLECSDAVTAVELLETQGYVDICRISLPYTPRFVQSVSLTEMGKGYRELERAKALNYITDKWTDILASIISIISLIVSIIALLRTK